MSHPIAVIFKRELLSYFSTPIAYVFIFIFLFLSAVVTFYLGGFYEQEHADLLAFFQFHPWLYLFLVPAIGMRTWAEEKNKGTLEIIMTLPVTLVQILLGKFLSAWFLLGIALSLTFPIWLTVNYLGEPDNGVIANSYFGSWLMAGAFLGISSCLSALTKNQVVAFVLSVLMCFIFALIGTDLILAALAQWFPNWVVDYFSSLSIITHFEFFTEGVVRLSDVIYFLVLIVAWLYLNYLVVVSNHE